MPQSRHAVVDAVSNTATEIPPGRDFILGPIRYPANWLTHATPAELAAIGARPIVEADPIPPGQRVVGVDLVVQAGEPVEVLTLQDIPTPELAAAKLQAIRDRRWQAETAGVVVGGQAIRTDEKTQGKVTGALKLLDLDPSRTSVDWEAVPGVFVTLDKATLEAIGLAIGGHIQACFTRSKVLTLAVLAARDNADRAALLAIDIETGWPA